MAGNLMNSTIMEGQSISRPPYFDGTNYTYWKERMKIFIQSIDYKLWLVIKNGPTMPKKMVDGKEVEKREEEFSDEDMKKMEQNAKAKNIFYCAVNPDDFRKISRCQTAKQMWDKLEVTYEGTSQVKEAKIDMLVHEYELFNMRDDEKIEEMFERFSNIVNTLDALGKVYTDRELVRKILRSLTKEWQSKVAAIQEGRDLNTITYDDLRGNLITYETTFLNKVHDENRKKKGMALKATSSYHSKEGDEESQMNEDEEIAFLTKRLYTLQRKKSQATRRHKVKKDQPNEELNKDQVICYGCKEPGHYKSECPHILKKKFKKAKKKKAMVATWSDSDDSSSESEQEDKEEVANMCFMAKSHEEVSDEDSFYTYDELNEMLDQALEDSQKLTSKYFALKSKYDSALNEIEKLRKIIETQRLESAPSENEKVLIAENASLKGKVDELTKDLASFVKGRENLDILLGKQKCSFDKAGLGFNQGKTEKYYKNFFVKASALTTPYITCNYCGKKGHFAYACVNKKNGSNKMWIAKGLSSNSNLQGPKKIWVPKIR